MTEPEAGSTVPQQFGAKRCPHCEHEIRDPGATACIYCGLPLTDPGAEIVVLELPPGILLKLAADAVASGLSGWPLVRRLRQCCLTQRSDDVTRWGSWLVLAGLLGETCWDWTRPEIFIRHIAGGKVDFERLRDRSRHGVVVDRFHADGSPQVVSINPRRMRELPESIRVETDAILGRGSKLEPEHLQEIRRKVILSMIDHRAQFWARWRRFAIARRWLWLLVVLAVLLILLLARYL